MATQSKLYITASELAELLGISVGHAYKIIKKLNVELEKEGYLKHEFKFINERMFKSEMEYLLPVFFR